MRMKGRSSPQMHRKPPCTPHLNQIPKITYTQHRLTPNRTGKECLFNPQLRRSAHVQGNSDPRPDHIVPEEIALHQG